MLTMRQRILEANDCMTQDALRVLGLAYRLVTRCIRQYQA